MSTPERCKAGLQSTDCLAPISCSLRRDVNGNMLWFPSNRSGPQAPSTKTPTTAMRPDDMLRKIDGSVLAAIAQPISCSLQES